MASALTRVKSHSASTVEFYYPGYDRECSQSVLNPIDKVCSQIVSALEKHKWSFPGITVTFHDLQVGSKTYRKVETLEGAQYKIWFSRKQGFEACLGGCYNNTAAVKQIHIPQKELNVYADGSGPTLYVYVGDNWKQDREKFVKGNKTGAKEHGEPRTYLKYRGSFQSESHLLSVNEGEYSPKNGEPTSYKTAEVFKEFISYLEDNVLKKLEDEQKTSSIS